MDRQIVINRSIPFVLRLAQIIILLFATAIFLSYAIQFYVPLEILLPAAKARFPRRETLVDYGLRYAFVLVTCKYSFPSKFWFQKSKWNFNAYKPWSGAKKVSQH